MESQKLFISNVAHELRTPLSTIKTSSEVALLDPSLPRDARESFTEIVTELERISEILNNLLSLGSLARPEVMQFRSLDILPIAEGVYMRMKPLARERGIRMRLKGSPDSIAWANPTAVDQIIANTLKNAIYYTPEDTNGRVDITIRPVGDHRVLIEIQDSGMGIGPEDLAHIFEPFYRADPSRTKVVNKKVGSGLGLTIVRELVLAMRGTIEIESRRRKGTTVRMLLPAGGWRRENSSVTHVASGTIASKREETAIWSPIRAAVTFLRGK